ALLKSIGVAFEESTPRGSRFHFPAKYLARVSYSTVRHAPRASQELRPKAPAAAASIPLDYARIARELRTPAQILDAVRARVRRRPAHTFFDAARTPLDNARGQIWANLLGLASVGIHENFFDLGGHSLLAVQLLSLVRQTFALELSLRVVYSGDFTVAELAKAIELREIENAGADRATAILRELESLSDEAVRALVAREQDGDTGGKPESMRILLTSSASHVPPRGGSTRSNLAWLDALAAGGHPCRVVGGALSTDTPEKLAQVRHELEDQQIELASSENYAVADPVKRAAVLKQQIREFQPDWVLVSSEDIGQGLLRAAHDAASGRVVYLAHTPQF